MAEREIMSQRGSVVAYMTISIALSIGAGYGVYAYLRDHKSAEAATTTREAEAEPPPPPRPVAVPQAVPPAPEVVEPPAISVAEQRAVDPIIDPEYNSSPVMGVPGIDGSISRGSVDRRMRAKSVELQRCWESDGDPAMTIHATLHVDAAGRVTSTSVTPGLSAGAEACVLAVLTSISFSAPGKSVEVVQPIAFR